MPTRRHFLKQAGLALTGSSLLFHLNRLAHAGEASGDYRALVCLFLYGGNDANNMLIPLDTGGYGQYSAVRGVSSGINIPQANWLPIHSQTQGARAFGLHPDLKGIKALYDQGRAAALCNVGTLLKPLSRSEYRSGIGRPANLFSHLDQVNQWQTASANTGLRPSGWGGRLADASRSLSSGSGSFPLLASLSGVNLFTTGLREEVIAPGSSSLKGFNSSAASQARYDALRKLETLNAGNTLMSAKNLITGKAIDHVATLNTALATLPALGTTFPTSSLGKQLETVARMIALREVLGLKRQVFFCSLGGFDTHTNQLSAQSSLFQTLDTALTAFHTEVSNLGLDRQVTSFTLSDFGRTFKPSSGAGSDHGWGSHHFIMGGAVKGGDLYGRYPSLTPGDSDDADTEGRWIPSTSVDEYGKQLALWFGINDLSQVFPNLDYFDSTRTDLDFMMTA